MNLYDQILTINSRVLTKKYIESLNKEERLALIDPIFDKLRNIGWILPQESSQFLQEEYQKLIDYSPDVNTLQVFNNSSLGTKICRHFCPEFYQAIEKKQPSLVQNFNNDYVLKKMIANRLGLDWLEADSKGPGVNEAFNLSYKMLVFQAQRSMRLVHATSIFKPSIAKYIALKYSHPGDIIGDYSCGFGARLLGAISCGRKYFGIDPLTVPSLQRMSDFYQFGNAVTLIHSGSEHVVLQDNFLDLAWSSPPYFDQEIYSSDPSQAYAQGQEYFYQTYWKNTLINFKHMLKPNKIFGVNVKNFPQMLRMTQEIFGDVYQEIQLKTVKSHLTKSQNNNIKYESIYLFKNIK